MLIESYNKMTTYLMAVLSPNLIFLIIGLTTFASIAYFVMISYIITQMDKRYFVRRNIIHKKMLYKRIINKKELEHKVGGDASESSSKKLLKNSLGYLVSTLKIFVGLCLLLCGIAMLVLPGQGLLTILIGLSLLPFPGKNKLEQKLLALKSVRASLNWIRAKANKDAFIFD